MGRLRGGTEREVYRITRKSRKELETEKAHWLSFAGAMNSVLNNLEEL